MAQTGSTGLFRVGGILMRGGIIQLAGSGNPTNGTSGTGVGKAAPGSVYMDYLNGVEWRNVGTKASPTWTPTIAILFSVTSANILAMSAVPVNLIAAPPAGFALIVNSVTFIMTRTATAYANGGVVNLVYTGGAVSPHSGTVPASVVTGGAGVVINGNGGVSAANGVVVPTATGVDITNATAPFITGTGTMKVAIDYRVVRQA